MNLSFVLRSASHRRRQGIVCTTSFQCVPYIHDACSSNHLTACSLGANSLVSIPAAREQGAGKSCTSLCTNSTKVSLSPRTRLTQGETRFRASSVRVIRVPLSGDFSGCNRFSRVGFRVGVGVSVSGFRNGKPNEKPTNPMKPNRDDIRTRFKIGKPVSNRIGLRYGNPIRGRNPHP